MTTRSIHEFDDLMKDLLINVNTLGCVMLPTEPFDLFGEGRDRLLDTEDLYVSSNPAKFWVNGDVSDDAHVTLHAGLMQPAYLQKDYVDTVLEAWDRPEYLAPTGITFFPSPDKLESDYAAIVVEFDDPSLIEAHQRLSYLPHVNTFPDYNPHMTLAYVRLDAAQRWMDILSQAEFHVYVTDGELNYGSAE